MTLYSRWDQSIPKKRNAKFAEKALQIAKKAKEKRKIYQSESRVQIIARKDKKAFLSDQCKEEKIECEGLEISSRKLEIPKEYFIQ